MVFIFIYGFVLQLLCFVCCSVQPVAFEELYHVLVSCCCQFRNYNTSAEDVYAVFSCDLLQSDCGIGIFQLAVVGEQPALFQQLSAFLVVDVDDPDLQF